jgi:hypothetical protein
MAFKLTVEKYLAIVEYIAGQKRQHVHENQRTRAR